MKSAYSLRKMILFSLGFIFYPYFAQAAPVYEFVPAPNIELNRVYRVNKGTGEVIACQFGLKSQSIGFTLCLKPGEGAGEQTKGDYGLIATRHQKEGGIFRVNYKTGDMSVCYVFGLKVVCTPQTAATDIDDTGGNDLTPDNNDPN